MLTEQQWLLGMLGIGALLFVVGLFLILTRQNLLFVLMGIELLLNGANVNLVAFSKYYPEGGGQLMVLFVLLVAAAEASVGLALLLALWKSLRSTRTV